jgi:hypothetical protein
MEKLSYKISRFRKNILNVLITLYDIFVIMNEMAISK